MQRLIVFLILFSIFFFRVFSQAPSGYYTPAEGLTGSELKSALHNIIKGHKTFPYTSSSTDVWDILKESDRDPANPANVILFYTGWSVNAAQEYNNNNGWNREHVWAKSHGPFDENTQGPGTDCHHLRPSDISVNAARGNYYFDNADIEYIDPSGATGCKYNSARYVWEPRDVEKGDAARMIFYMSTRYEGDDAFPDLEVVDYIPSNYSSPLFGDLSTLIGWNLLDPVDTFEMNRNNVVYKYQKNRNPFIDHPEYVDLIWGPSAPINIPPQITSVYYSPDPVYSSDTIHIIASANDADGSVDSVKIHWGFSAGTFSDSSLMVFSNGQYNFNIEAQEAGTVVYFFVVAWDNNLAKTTSSEQNFIVQAINILPQLTNISYFPESPTSTDSLQFNANATDIDGFIQNVKLYWGYSPADLSNYSEMIFLIDRYSVIIPPQNAGAEIFFKIEAWDNSDASGFSEVQSFFINGLNDKVYDREISGFIYPNPASGTVYVEHKTDEWLEIFSSEGKKLIQTQNHIIDLSHMNQGLYLVHINNGNGNPVKILKLVKK